MNPVAQSKLAAACGNVVGLLRANPAPNVPKCLALNDPKCPALSRNVSAQTQINKTNPNSSPEVRRIAPPRPLAPRQLTAINLLFDGATVANAARTLNINRRTIFRWLKQPLFRAEVDQRIADARKCLALSRNVSRTAVSSKRTQPPSPLNPLRGSILPTSMLGQSMRRRDHS
jgi:hypothetical protein